MKIKVFASVVVALIFCLIGAWFIEKQTKQLHRWLDEYVYDNYNHYLPCDKLPTEVEVRRVISDHMNIVTQIQAVNPGSVGIEVSTPDCPGKADLLIWYPSHHDRVEIETILGSESFFGIPVRLHNR